MIPRSAGMSYTLSILDKSPIPPGATAADALANTVVLARRAEELDYKRFWVAEHHGSPLLASSAPEALAAYLLAATRRIRIGTGGVMLQHYSPFKVAEVFRVLENLAPGRVDLGVGKAPGGLPYATQALQSLHDKVRKPSFEASLEELDGFLKGALPQTHPLAKAEAKPDTAHLPERILLGASPESAALAARLDWGFCFAGHFNGDAAAIEKTFAAYHPSSGRRPQLALFAVAASSGVRAAELAGEVKLFTVHLPGGQRINLPSLEAIDRYVQEAGVSDYRIEEKHPRILADTPERIRTELDALSERFGVEEFIIDNPVPTFADRLASVELLGEATLARAA
jgi:luciferase family oxidoreductase group 1